MKPTCEEIINFAINFLSSYDGWDETTTSEQKNGSYTYKKKIFVKPLSAFIEEEEENKWFVDVNGDAKIFVEENHSFNNEPPEEKESQETEKNCSWIVEVVFDKQKLSVNNIDWYS